VKGLWVILDDHYGQRIADLEKKLSWVILDTDIEDESVDDHYGQRIADLDDHYGQRMSLPLS